MLKKSFKSLLPFLPLMVLYIVVVLVFSSNELINDEIRYIRYATNFTHGFFTDEGNPDLGNGPGYPLILSPFVAFNADFIILRLFNVFFVIAGIIFFSKTIALFTKKKYAIFFAYLIGLYPPLIRFMPEISTEGIAFMIICALIFHVYKLYQDEGIEWKHVLITSLCLGFLVLVKIIFLHVILVSAAILTCLFLVKRNRHLLKVSLVLVGGILFITPYIFYTYALTGKLFYLGTGGGEILYHRSTPFENEWGNWFSREDALNGANPDYNPDNVYRDLGQLSENHRETYLALEPLTFIERDSTFKAIALENMRAHPSKYVKNTVSNIGRLLFHYPFSYREQNLDAYGYMLPNMFILVLWTLSLYPAFLSRKKMPFQIKAIMVFTLIYAFGIVLSEGRGRNFIIMVPPLVLFFSYVYKNILKITLVKIEEVK